MLDENVVQPLLVTTSALNLATECVRMILKVPLTASQLCGLLWEGHACAYAELLTELQNMQAASC